MNIEKIINRRKKELLSLQNEITGTLSELDNAKELTIRLLEKCQKAKIKIVSIGVESDLLPETKSWPFDHSGSIFTDNVEINGWPAIWRVLDEMPGLGNGCGNSNQKQANTDLLIEGTYQFKNKKWIKVN